MIDHLFSAQPAQNNEEFSASRSIAKLSQIGLIFHLESLLEIPNNQ